MIRSLVKWTFRLVLMPAVLLVAGFILAFYLIPQAKLRAMASEELGRRTYRQVTIGPMHLGLRGLDIEHLRLSERPNFQVGTAIDATDVRLGWDLQTLWEGLHLREKTITRSRGSFSIDEFHNPHYSARHFALKWSLSGIDPTGSTLSGWANLQQGEGDLNNLTQLTAASPSAKLALMPVTMLMNLDRAGIVRLGLPDLNHWHIQSIEGRYAFDKGLMHIEHFQIASAQLGMGASGIVELSTGKLSVDVELKSPKNTALGAMDLKTHVTGTLSNPEVDLESLKKKAFRATITRLLEDPQARDALKKLFR